MQQQVQVLWVSHALQSAEHCSVEIRPAGASLTGTTLLPFNRAPAQFDYNISIDGAWHTQTLRVEFSAAHQTRSIDLARSASGWSVNDVARPDLDPCIDVDLGWTPATNLLPLRRCPLTIGESVTTTAAWLRFPELDVVPSEQTYTRLAEDRVRYQSSTFEADLEVTGDGIVTRYGDDLWTAASIHRSDAN